MAKSYIFALTLLFSITPILSAGPIHDAARGGNMDEVKKLLAENPDQLQLPDSNGTTPLLCATIEGHADLVKYLVEAGADINAVNNRRSNALQLAAYFGHVELIEYFLEKGFNINGPSDAAFTPLTFSIMTNKPDAAKYLIEHGADQNIADRTYGGYPFHWACVRSDSVMFDLLFSKGFDIRLPAATDSTPPLMWAAHNGNAAAIRWLISKGLDPDLTMSNGWTVLHNAARAGHVEAVKALLDGGANFDRADNNGTTPLGSALFEGRVDIARMLIDAGASIHHRGEQGETILHQAVFGGNAEVITLILNHGVDINSATTRGYTPLHYAVFGNDSAAVRLLLDKGADVDAGSETGSTPLFAAAARSAADIVKILVENGADINAPGTDGFRPIMNAVRCGDTETVQYLLSKGVKIDFVDSINGRTPLHWASIKGYQDICRMLIESGGDMNAKDAQGRSALAYADKYGHKRISDMIASAGCKLVGDTECNFGPSPLLKKSINDGEAYLWYTGHCGWAVKTKNNLLIFDYWKNGPEPDEPSLANGHINPDEIKDLNVTVFVSHEHQDHYDTTICGWKDNVPNISYIFGCHPELRPIHRQSGLPVPPYEFMAPHQYKTINGLEITTIDANDAGVGFMVQVDGLNLYFAGDHAGWREGQQLGFTREIDYLDSLFDRVDIAFLNVTGCHAGDTIALEESVCYVMDKLKPAAWIPTHGADRENVYNNFAEKIANRGYSCQALCAENKGDRFFYKLSAI